jgi:hypothetical protein
MLMRIYVAFFQLDYVRLRDKKNNKLTILKINTLITQQLRCTGLCSLQANPCGHYCGFEFYQVRVIRNMKMFV